MIMAQQKKNDHHHHHLVIFIINFYYYYYRYFYTFFLNGNSFAYLQFILNTTNKFTHVGHIWFHLYDSVGI